MNAQDFAYWLQGFAELNEGPPSAEQWQSICDHLSLVFKKATPLLPSYKQRQMDDPFQPPYSVRQEQNGNIVKTIC